MKTLPYEQYNTNGTLKYDINDVIGYIVHRAFANNYKCILYPYTQLSDYYKASSVKQIHRRHIYRDIDIRLHFRGLLLSWLKGQSPIKSMDAFIEQMFPSQTDYMSWCDCNYGKAKNKKIFTDRVVMVQMFPEIPIAICGMLAGQKDDDIKEQLLDVMDKLIDE